MKKNSPKAISQSLPMFRENNFIEDSPFVDWMLNNSKHIVWCLGGGFIALLLLSMWLLNESSETSKNYLATINAFQQFEKASTTPQLSTALAQLNTDLNKSPNLHAKYDSEIAQVLLTNGQIASAKPFAESVLSRTKSDKLNGYTSYASTSLLIADGEYKQALEQSLALKSDLSIAADTNTDLFAFNLLRIAFLQIAAGEPASEIVAWKEWQKYDANSKSISDAKSNPYLSIGGLFIDGKLSLQDYIDARIKTAEALLQ